jgi:hypothetical protein
MKTNVKEKLYSFEDLIGSQKRGGSMMSAQRILGSFVFMER